MISTKKGFTLLEMLLVIAIIAILAAIVIVAINPAKQLGDANNAQRQSDILAILNAVHQYAIDNSGDISDLDIAQESSPNIATLCADGEEDGTNAVCENGESCGGVSNLDILADDDPNYITDIPVDPLQSTITNGYSGYVIYQDDDTGRITVCAPLAENDETGETLSVTR